MKLKGLFLALSAVVAVNMAAAAEPITDEAEVKDYLAPYKLGRPILAPSGEPGAFDRLAVDHARLFRHRGRIYMMYIGFDGVGYQTALASTADMLHWTKHGVVFARGQSKNGWDMNGRAISCFLQENDLYGSRELIEKDGKYWLMYHAYPGKGYESGGAANGLAWTTDEKLLAWHCLDKPVFEKGPDPSSWDGAGLYSVWVVPRDGTYWLYYNGKSSPSWPWKEQVGVAFAEDDSLTKWRRYGRNPVCTVGQVGWDRNFTCGQGVMWDARRSRWMRYFCGLGGGPGAQEGVAVSPDGLNWRSYARPVVPVGKPGEIDSIHAHKGAAIWHDGKLWLVYCAVRPLKDEAERTKFKTGNWNEYRCLTLARSVPFTAAEIESLK